MIEDPPVSGGDSGGDDDSQTSDSPSTGGGGSTGDTSTQSPPTPGSDSDTPGALGPEQSSDYDFGDSGGGSQTGTSTSTQGGNQPPTPGSGTDTPGVRGPEQYSDYESGGGSDVGRATNTLMDPGPDPVDNVPIATSEGIEQQIASQIEGVDAADVTLQLETERPGDTDRFSITVDRDGGTETRYFWDDLDAQTAEGAGVDTGSVSYETTDDGFTIVSDAEQAFSDEIRDFASDKQYGPDDVIVTESEPAEASPGVALPDRDVPSSDGGFAFAPDQDARREVIEGNITEGRSEVASQLGLSPDEIQVTRENGEVSFEPTQEAQQELISQQVAAETEGIGADDVSVTPTEEGYDIEVAERDFQAEVRYGETQAESMFGTDDRDRALVEAADEGSVGGQLFTGGRALEVIGQRGSDALDDAIPDFDVGPEIGTGGESIGSQTRNWLVETPSGAGFLAGLAPRGVGNVIASGEDAIGTTDIDDDAFHSGSEVAAGWESAGTQAVEGIFAEPFGAFLDIATPYAVSRGASGVRSASQAAGTRLRGNIESGRGGLSGSTGRGQADLTGPEISSNTRGSGDSVVEIDTDATSPDFDPRPGPGQRRPGRLSDQSLTQIRGGGPRSRTAGGVSRGFADQPARAGIQVTDATTTSTRGMLARMEAAAAPSWLTASQTWVEEDTSTLSDSEEMLGTTLDQRTDQDVTQREITNEATLPTISEDVGSLEDADTSIGQDSGTASKAGQDSDTRQRQRDAVTLQPFPGLQTPNITPRDGFPTDPMPDRRPGRRRRLRIPGGDDEEEGLSIPNLGFADVSVPATETSDGLRFGWVSESVTDIGTLGMELPNSPGESRLRDLSAGLPVGSDLPTEQLLDDGGDTGSVADTLTGGVAIDVFGDGGEDVDGSDGWLQL